MRGHLKKMYDEQIRDRILIHSAYRRLFETPDGKAVMRHILKNAYVGSTTFVRGDTHQTALNEGSRRLALSILRYATKDPQQILDEVQESLTNDH